MDIKIEYKINTKSIEKEIKKNAPKNTPPSVIDYKVKQTIDGQVISNALGEALKHTGYKSIKLSAMEYFYNFPTIVNGLIDIQVFKWNHISNTITSGFIPLKSFVAIMNYFNNNNEFKDDVLVTDIPDGGARIVRELTECGLLDFKKLSGTQVTALQVKRFGQVITSTLGNNISIFNTVQVDNSNDYGLIYCYTIIYSSELKQVVGVDTFVVNKDLVIDMWKNYEVLQKEVTKIKKAEAKKQKKAGK